MRRGLLEFCRVRGDALKFAVDRRKVILFLGGTACPRGDSENVLIGLVGLCALGLKARASASGEMGERGESDLCSWKREGLEGERERERRSCCRCAKWVPSRRYVGEGKSKCMVPPSRWGE